jgi:hypothetical protein
MVGEAIVDMEFEQDFGIYNISRLMSTLSLFNDPTVTVDNKQIVFKEGRRKVEYTLTDKNSFVTPPDKDITAGHSALYSFDLSNETFTELRKAVAALQLDSIVFNPGGELLVVSGIIASNPTSDAYRLEVDIEVESTKIQRYNAMYFNSMLKGQDYTLDVYEKFVKVTGQEVSYIVACEANA